MLGIPFFFDPGGDRLDIVSIPQMKSCSNIISRPKTTFNKSAHYDQRLLPDFSAVGKSKIFSYPAGDLPQTDIIGMSMPHVVVYYFT